MKTLKKLIQIPFHPLLLGLYPVLALYAWNQGETGFDAAARLVLVCLVIAVVLFALLRLVLRDWLKAALLTSLILVLFYSYGQVYAEIKSAEVLGVIIGRHRYLAGLWGILLIGLGWLILKPRQNLANFTRSINLIRADIDGHAGLADRRLLHSSRTIQPISGHATRGHPGFEGSRRRKPCRISI